MTQQKRRSLEELRMRAQPIIHDEKLVMIAKHAASPNAAYQLAIMNNVSEELAHACRWLAMILRDYGKQAFEDTIQQ